MIDCLIDLNRRMNFGEGGLYTNILSSVVFFFGPLANISRVNKVPNVLHCMDQMVFHVNEVHES